MVNCINLIIEMSPHFILGRENVPCVAEVVNRSLKADCTDYTIYIEHNDLGVGFHNLLSNLKLFTFRIATFQWLLSMKSQLNVNS